MGLERSGPIFVAGADRSGIGLLTDVLNTHRSIHLSRRTRFWDRHADGVGELRDEAELRAVLGAIAANPRMTELEADPERLVREFSEHGGPVTYGWLFESIHRHHLERTGMSRWGDKSLDAEVHAVRIFDEFPDAVMIHVVRDPRDRYVSLATHRGVPRGGPGAGTALWLRSARLAARHSKRYPERYVLVRYEDLATDPRSTLTRLCELIGEPFDPRMLTEFPMPPSHRPSGPSLPAAGHAFSPVSVGRYRTDLPRSDIAFVDLVARRRMHELGYAPSGIRLTGNERARFVAVDLPLNLARLLAWQLNDRIRVVRARVRRSRRRRG